MKDAKNLATNLTGLLKSKPTFDVGMMVLNGELREVYFPAIGKVRVLFKMHYCTSEEEAISEAEKVRHTAEMQLTEALRQERDIALNISHWSEHLSIRVRACVMKAIKRNLAGMPASKAKHLLLVQDVRERLVATMSDRELDMIVNALGIDLRMGAIWNRS